MPKPHDTRVTESLPCPNFGNLTGFNISNKITFAFRVSSSPEMSVLLAHSCIYLCAGLNPPENKEVRQNLWLDNSTEAAYKAAQCKLPE